MKKHIDKTKKVAENLLDKLKIDYKIEIAETPEMFWLDVKTEDSPLLIGYRGENLFALEHILKLLLQKEFRDEEFPRISLDIGGIRKDQINRIKENAEHMAEKVVKSQKSEVLPPMNAHERRIVHTVLGDIEGVITESIGEEPARRIVIRPKG